MGIGMLIDLDFELVPELLEVTDRQADLVAGLPVGELLLLDDAYDLMDLFQPDLVWQLHLLGHFHRFDIGTALRVGLSAYGHALFIVSADSALYPRDI